MPVPFFDWRALYAERAEAYSRIVSDTAARGGFILQGAVDEFEASLEAYRGVRHVAGLSNGTDAMLLGLRAALKGVDGVLSEWGAAEDLRSVCRRDGALPTAEPSGLLA